MKQVEAMIQWKYEIKDSPSLQSMSDKYHATAIFHDIHRLSTSFNYLTIVWQRSHVTNTSETNIFSYLNSAADALCSQELESTFRTMGKPPNANRSHYLNYWLSPPPTPSPLFWPSLPPPGSILSSLRLNLTCFFLIFYFFLALFIASAFYHILLHTCTYYYFLSLILLTFSVMSSSRWKNLCSSCVTTFVIIIVYF